MELSRAFVIVNVRSGNHDEEAIRDALAQSMGRAGVEYELARCPVEQDVDSCVRRGLDCGFPLIVVAGGDGTVAACADAVSRTDAVLGVLPTGTGNLIARELGIPLDLHRAAQVLLNCDLRAMDAMEVDGGRRCFSHISMGTYARIAEMDAPEEKKRYGRFAYVRLLLREASEGESWRFRIARDGVERTVRASLVMAANVGATGLPGLRWREDAAPDDGVIDLCVVRARSPLEYLRLIASALLGRQSESNQIEYEEVRESLRIEGPGRSPVRGDGESIGEGGVAIRMLPRVLKVIAP